MAGAEPITDRKRIREWAEARGGRPAIVRGTEILRIDFPADGPDQNLEPITWEEWFGNLTENNLAVLLQDRKDDGELSTFNKIVSADTVAAKG